MSSDEKSSTLPAVEETVASEIEFTRKCDIRLVPILGGLYFTAFLDRVNIANAKLLGFEKDLHMPANGYNTALWVFFLSFVLLEVPCNMFLNWHRLKPNQWLGGTMFFLGIVSMCQGLTQSAGGLYACRFIMGALEGSLAPGAALLMGQYYRRHEFGIRFACFFVCALLSNACSSFLAYAIGHMEGVHGVRAWRWIFILEGLFSICYAVLAFFVIPAFPKDATFLTKEERELLLQRLEEERGNEKVSMRDINWVGILWNWKVWLATLIYFCGDLSSSSNVSFSPTILSQLGWSASKAQVHQIPIYLVAVTTSIIAHIWSGRVGVRFPFILVGVATSLIGWAIQLAELTDKPAVRYFGLFMISAGASIQMPLSVAWLNNNLIGRPEKAVAAAIQMGFGNGANFVSSNMFITAQAPRYPTAFRVGTSFAVIGGVATLFFTLLLVRENRRLDKQEAEGNAVPVNPGSDDGTRFRNTL
ncbi:hypothetical protein OIDMADRAFT_99409 [Oidiodendron maius Zn]|uniref:Major facilitator superfamily (MFS) profile domain-containing protein n=1 Tax=Oidiodendron maius (strain Zn) TaxID=913774 RepID=A0A0C3HY49_OIDMZ|nr:hypothetical protein OIDMADRAFT_99409 [Oidiodendron maius Zn]